MFFTGSGGTIDWLPEPQDLDPTLKEARDGYRRVGRLLAENATGYDEIRTVLRSIRETTSHDPPFVVVDAPSGSGKTQLGFTLEVLGLRVLHCTLHPSSAIDQCVYRAMFNVSTNIDQAVKADTLGITPTQYDWLQVQSLCVERRPLRLVQYFFRYFLNVDRPWDQCTVSALREKLDELDTLPVVVVDEVGNNRDVHGQVVETDLIRVRYIRNLCHALRIPCVLMGTNSNAMNMYEAATGSRTCVSVRWCTLVSGLPRVMPQSRSALGLPSAVATLTEQRHLQLASLLEQTAPTANPLFVLALVNGIRRATESQWQQWGDSSRAILDELLATAAVGLFEEKCKLLTPMGLHGQFALQLNMYRGWRDHERRWWNSNVLDTTSAVFVASHFAALNTPRAVTNLLLGGSDLECDMSATGDGSQLRPWRPSAHFPDATVDPWLYLFCGGGQDGRHPPAFHADDLSGRAMSTADALVTTRERSVVLAAPQLNLSNVHTLKRDGNVLEALVGVAVVTASRRHGVGGMPLGSFLCRLAEELIRSDNVNKHRAVVEWRDAPMRAWVDGRLAGEGMPFLGALNATWPASLLDMADCHFGHCRRTRDMEKVDFAVSVRQPSTLLAASDPIETVVVLGECQHDWQPLDKNDIERTLRRALFRRHTDAHHRVHVAFASSLAANPFAKRSSWDTWKVTHATGVELQVARVVVSRDMHGALSLSLANLSATMPGPQVGCPCTLLVLFIAVEEWLCVLQKDVTLAPAPKRQRL